MKNQSVDFRVRAYHATRILLYSALLLAFMLGSATVTLAQATNAIPQDQVYGTRSSPTFGSIMVNPLLLLPPVPTTFTLANYGTGGVALRNRGTGNIGVSGVVGAVKAAFIYWAVINPILGVSDRVRLQRLANPPATPASAVVTLIGTPVGVGPQPCWIGTLITVYRAAIPLGVATGNGSYQVTLLPGAAGSTAGGDPWLAPVVLPLWEGASIVMIGTGTGTVDLFDVGLAGSTFIGSLMYTLLLSPNTAVTPKLWDNIGADGQIGASRTAMAGVSGETTTINGVAVAGPGSVYLNSDWDGSSGFPLPQLWDDTGHNITTSFVPAGTTVLTVVFGPANGTDCLTPVANVVLH